MCPNNAIEVNAVPEDRRNVWSFADMVEIERKSKLKAPIKYGDVSPGWSLPLMIIVVPAQVSRPIDKYREPCNTRVVLGGRYAENPLVLDTPIMIAAMSFGALSKEAKIALAMGATLAGTRHQHRRRRNAARREKIRIQTHSPVCFEGFAYQLST